MKLHHIATAATCHKENVQIDANCIKLYQIVSNCIKLYQIVMSQCGRSSFSSKGWHTAELGRPQGAPRLAKMLKNMVCFMTIPKLAVQGVAFGS